MVLKDSSGTTIWTVDNVEGSGAGGELLSNLDVNGKEIISSSSGNIEIHSDNDVNITLGDAAGVDDLNIKDSAGAKVAGIDSDGALTAVSYGGITEANLVDKSAAETITGSWDFGGATDLEVPNGAGGHAALDTTGQVTVDTTSKSLNFHDGASEAVLQPTRVVSITDTSPTTATDQTIMYTHSAITVTQLAAVINGGASTPSITYTIRFDADRSAAGTEVVTSGSTVTSASTATTVTSFNDATIPANNWIWMEIDAQSGTTPELCVSLEYTIDA
jgi:hypothetical protein